MADSCWSAALTYTVRMIYLHPELPELYHRRSSQLSGGEAKLLARWRHEASDLGKFRSAGEPVQLAKLLKAAAGYLKKVQLDLAATWACRTSCPDSGLHRAPQYARDLYAAIMAMSRTAGPEVMLSDRLAVDLIESMTGRRWVYGKAGSSTGITRAKRWLELHGFVSIRFLKGSGTTAFKLQQGNAPTEHADRCLATHAGEDLRDTRPALSEQDRLVLDHSASARRAGEVWVPGQAVAAAQDALQRLQEGRRRQKAEEAAQWAHARQREEQRAIQREERQRREQQEERQRAEEAAQQEERQREEQRGAEKAIQREEGRLAGGTLTGSKLQGGEIEDEPDASGGQHETGAAEAGGAGTGLPRIRGRRPVPGMPV